MTSRVTEVFEKTRAEGRAALITYYGAGFPTVEDSLKAYRTLVENGADIVEVGVPYSDPVLDGPVVQNAGDLARANGFHTTHVFDAVRTVVEAGGVAVVMSYWNVILRYGVERFAADLAAAGGSGVVTPDLIPDEAGEWLAAAEKHGLDPIFLVAPSSTPERLSMTVSQCRGFVYVASVMGVTGMRSEVGNPAHVLVERTREVTELPLAVGLGVSDREQAAEIASFADGVIVGSAVIRSVDTDAPFDESLPRLAELTRELAAGVRQGRA